MRGATAVPLGPRRGGAAHGRRAEWFHVVQVSGGTREILSPAGLPCAAAAATISVSVSGGVSFGPRPEHLLLGDRRLLSSASPAASPSAPSLSIQNSDQLRSQSRRARGGRRWWLGLPRPQAFSPSSRHRYAPGSRRAQLQKTPCAERSQVSVLHVSLDTLRVGVQAAGRWWSGGRRVLAAGVVAG